jgi:hypothetical protein
VYASGDEWVVAVRWLNQRPREKAFWKTGMFANQNSATKLRNRFTLDQLTAEFGVDEDAAGHPSGPPDLASPALAATRDRPICARPAAPRHYRSTGPERRRSTSRLDQR